MVHKGALSRIIWGRIAVGHIAVGLCLGLLGPAAAADCDGGTRVRFTLSVDGPSGELVDTLRAVSRLREVDGDCVRSARRLDSNLRSDLDRFHQVLRSYGFYAHRISHRLIPADDTTTISISIDPGEQYRIGSTDVVFWQDSEIQLTGGLYEEAEAKLPLKVTAPARAEDVVKAEGQLVTALSENGYPFAEPLERRVVVDHSTKLLNVTYNILPGPRKKLGMPVYSGLETVEERYLDRLVPWDEEIWFQQTKMEEYRTRLLSTGLFASVSASLDNETSALTLDPDVALKETLHRRVELGAGYATGEGFEADASWVHRNFLGQGETLKLSITAGETEQELNASFRKPNWRRYDQSLNLQTTLGHEKKPAYTTDFLEAFTGVDRRLSRHMTGSVGSSIRVEDLKEEDGKTRSLILAAPVGLTYDRSDSVLDPTRGYRLSAKVQPTLSVSSKDAYFLSSDVRGSAYVRMPGSDSVVFAARVRLGSIWGAVLDQVPDTERFYAGGGGSVRGFGYQRLGAQTDDGSPLGGRSVTEVSFETRVRFTENISVVPFLDGGMVYASELPKFDGLRWGAGLGLRYHTSFAPIRVDFAVPIDRREDEDKFAVYISIGQSF